MWVESPSRFANVMLQADRQATPPLRPRLPTDPLPRSRPGPEHSSTLRYQLAPLLPITRQEL